jgi:hypothetical protein
VVDFLSDDSANAEGFEGAWVELKVHSSLEQLSRLLYVIPDNYYQPYLKAQTKMGEGMHAWEDGKYQSSASHLSSHLYSHSEPFLSRVIFTAVSSVSAWAILNLVCDGWTSQNRSKWDMQGCAGSYFAALKPQMLLTQPH